MLTVVVDPRFAQHLPAEAAGELGVVGTVLGVGAVLVPLVVEGVRGRSQADDRLARFDVIDNVLHLLVGQFAEAGEEHQQVGRIEGFQPGDVLRTGIDQSGLRIDGEEHGAGATVMDGEDLGQLRNQFLAAVLVVGGDEHDVFAHSRPGLALQHGAGASARTVAAARQEPDGRRCGPEVEETAILVHGNSRSVEWGEVGSFDLECGNV